MRLGDLIAHRFEVEALAGQGGMGIVYRARDRHTGRPVALKVLKRDAVPQQARFLQEVRVLASLRHPSIVRYVGHGSLPTGDPYLAMEWLVGESLWAHVKSSGPLSVDDTIAMAFDVVEALGVAHAHGVIHRDLKPSNLLLVDGDPRRTKLLDFGIARVDDITLTSPGDMVGTPGYIAPEQARAERDIDGRADFFGLGCALFFALSGVSPFSGSDLPSILLKLVLDDEPSICELRADVPPEVAAMLRLLLAKQREDRPMDASAVSEELRKLRGALAERPHAASPARNGQGSGSSLTDVEQRFACLVLARNHHGPHSGDDAHRGATVRSLLREAVGGCGGRLDELVDGSVLVTFLADGTPADQAARAAECAILLRKHLPPAPIAVVAGQAKVGAPRPLAQVIARAVVLTSTAVEPSIVLDETISGLLDARFDVASDGSGHVLFGERLLTTTGRPVLGTTTTLVGRHRELSALIGAFEECVAEAIARPVIVRSPAGLGKSRLGAEFLRRIGGGDVQVWTARGEAMSAGSPLRLIAALVRQAAGILESEPPESQRNKLGARVGAGRVAEFLGELIGVPFPDASSVELRAARHDTVLMGDQMRRAWEDFLGAECDRRPVVLVLEDLHWGDTASTSFVDAALRVLSDKPLLVLALARPDASSIATDLWADRDAIVIDLAPLSRRSSRRLAREILGAKAPEDTVDSIADRAGGNAFYLEELIRTVARDGDAAMPATVLAMVQTRLDAVTPEQRRVLRAASVFGQTFWLEGLVAPLGLAPPAIKREIEALERDELVAAVPQSKFSNTTAYAFRSGLLHEAAYSLLTDEDRTLGHRLAAEWLGAVGEREAITLAEHFSRGREPVRARSWYRRAAEHGIEGDDLARAIECVERAIECGAEGEELGELRLIEAVAHSWRADFVASERCAREALLALPPRGPSWFEAAAELATALGKLTKVDELGSFSDQLEEARVDPAATPAYVTTLARAVAELVFLGEQARADHILRKITSIVSGVGALEPSVEARIHRARASRADNAGNPEASLGLLEAAARSFERAGDARNACLQRVNIANSHIEFGDHQRAEEVLHEALATAKRLGIDMVKAFALANLGLALSRLGRLEEALSTELEAIEGLDPASQPRMHAIAQIYVTSILCDLGRLEEAAGRAVIAIDVAKNVPPVRAYAAATLAKVRLAQGRVTEAMAGASAAMEGLIALGGTDEGEELIHLVYAESALASGDRAKAEAAIGAARSRLIERSSRIKADDLRHNFLERVPENARTMELAREWLRPEHAEPAIPPSSRTLTHSGVQSGGPALPFVPDVHPSPPRSTASEDLAPRAETGTAEVRVESAFHRSELPFAFVDPKPLDPWVAWMEGALPRHVSGPVVPIVVYAAIVAALWRGRRPRSEILADARLTEVDWVEHERRLAAAVDVEAGIGKAKLAQAVATAIRGAQEHASADAADHPALHSLAAFIALKVRMELAQDGRAVLEDAGLDALGWLAMDRHWAHRSELDPALAAELRSELQAARRARGPTDSKGRRRIRGRP